MAIGKVVVLSSHIEAELWKVFMTEKPAGWQITVVNPDDGEQKVAKQLEDAQYLVTLHLQTPVTSTVLEKAKQLKLIQTSGQGTNHLPVKWALERGILIANAGGTNVISVAEHTMLLILACLRRFPLYDKSIHQGKFKENIDWKGTHELDGKTVGIVGFGNIGKRVSKLCYSFGANIIYFDTFFIPFALRADSKAQPVNLDEVLTTSDIVSLHVPLLESTRGMIGWPQFTKMKPSAYIVNTSRGDIIDQVALIRALNEKIIAGAGLDVWEPEPPDPKNPLLQMSNVVATPHMGGISWENRKLSYWSIWNNIVLVSEGKEPLNQKSDF